MKKRLAIREENSRIFANDNEVVKVLMEDSESTSSEATAGRGCKRCILLTGPSGVGKTTLLNHFRNLVSKAKASRRNQDPFDYFFEDIDPYCNAVGDKWMFDSEEFKESIGLSDPNVLPVNGHVLVLSGTADNILESLKSVADGAPVMVVFVLPRPDVFKEANLAKYHASLRTSDTPESWLRHWLTWSEASNSQVYEYLLNKQSMIFKKARVLGFETKMYVSPRTGSVTVGWQEVAGTEVFHGSMTRGGDRD